MYNTRRPHTALGFATPEQVHHADEQLTAISPPPQRSVPVRYAHLHCALGRGEERNNQQLTHMKSTKFISGLDRQRDEGPRARCNLGRPASNLVTDFFGHGIERSRSFWGFGRLCGENMQAREGRYLFRARTRRKSFK